METNLVRVHSSVLQPSLQVLTGVVWLTDKVGFIQRAEESPQVSVTAGTAELGDVWR